MHASGSLVVSQTVFESQVSMATDNKELQASMALGKNKVCEYTETLMILHS